MTGHHDTLVELAVPYALDAVDDAERLDIERRVAAAPRAVADEFDAEVRAVRDTLAQLSELTATEPPSGLRSSVLGAVAVERQRPAGRPQRSRRILVSAAAGIAIGLIALGVGIALRPDPPASTAEAVIAAADLTTTSEDIPGGGTAMLLSSRNCDAAVVVMDGAAPPRPGTVYQLWLMTDRGPRAAGTMADSSTHSAVVSDLDDSQMLAISMEPGSGSRTPTSPMFASLPIG